jgi:hypothetical protein
MALVPAERNRDRERAAATFLITWVCYGTWLPGRSGAVPQTQNRFGAPLPEADIHRQRQAAERMIQRPYSLDALRRPIVLKSVQEVCSCRDWRLFAAHIRSTHVHVVIAATCSPEKVLAALKAYCSRALNRHALDGPDRRRWARHGSTRYLWTADAVQSAVQYVVREQGKSMAVFEMSIPR